MRLTLPSLPEDWLLYAGISALIFIGYLIPELGTLKHFATVVIIAIASFKKEVSIQRVGFLVGVLALMLYSLIIASVNPELYSLKFFGLFTSPAIAAFVFGSRGGKKVTGFIKMFFLTAVIFQLAVIFSQEESIRNLGILKLVLSDDSSNLLLSSSSGIENSFGFVFGYLGLYFLIRKEYRYFLLCLFLFFINYKRIVVIGFGMSAIYYLFTRIRFIKKIPFKTALSISPFILLLVIIEISSGNLNQLASEFTGKSMNHLTTGRYTIHHELYQQFFEFPRLFFGYGIGHTNSAVRTFDFTRMTLAHSDYLMFMYDFGLVGFTAFFVLFFRNFLTSVNNAVYIIFFLVVLIFDNTIIYFDVMFLLYLLLIHETEKSSLVLRG